MSPRRLPGPPHPDPSPHPDSARRGLFDEPDRTPAAALAACVQWWDRATRAVWELIAEGRTFDAQHITERVGEPYPGDGRRVAAFLTRHHRAGNIRHAGYIPTRRTTSHAVVSRWQPTTTGQRHARLVLDQDDDQTPAEGEP